MDCIEVILERCISKLIAMFDYVCLKFDSVSLPICPICPHAQAWSDPEVLIAQYRQDVDEIHAPGMGHDGS